MAVGLRAWDSLRCWFHFFPVVCALVRGWVRTTGVDVTLLSWFHSCRQCQSVLELRSLLLNAGRDVCAGNGYLLSDRR